MPRAAVSFATIGGPPPVTAAADRAGFAPDRARAALADLAAADLGALCPGDEVVRPFPLFAAETRHRVQVDGGLVLHARSAVDALGVPAMLGKAPCRQCARTWRSVALRRHRGNNVMAQHS